jgi:cbb3-type cytochrome oxidase subunit 3
MKSTPKIIVLKMREIIYTLLLLFLVILLILCLILMFSKKNGTCR